MKFSNLHAEIYENLSNGPLSIEQLTRRSKITKYETRLGRALRELEDEHYIELKLSYRHYASGQLYRRVR